MYAYNELKKQLEGVNQLHFIFTFPTFIEENFEKQKREFYTPRLSRENSLYGIEVELKKLKKELEEI